MVSTEKDINGNDSSSKEDLKIVIQELESKLSQAKDELNNTQKELHMCQGRLQEIRDEKKELQSNLSELELMKIDLELLNTKKIQNENDKIQHRIHVTKKLLDEAREDLKFNAEVIKDLEEQKLLDKIRGKLPDTLIVYKNKHR